MKKIIFTVTVLCALLVCFTSCGNSRNDDGQALPDSDITEGYTEDRVNDVKDPSVVIPPDDKDSEAHDKRLIRALINYLQIGGFDERNLSSSRNLPTDNIDDTYYDVYNLVLSWQATIKEIYQSVDPMLVGFASSDCYYMCAYYKTADIYEKANHFNAEDYTWVKYGNASEISEFNDGDPLVAAFQINKSNEVSSIREGNSNALSFEHFVEFYPEFADGVNVRQEYKFDKLFVFLNLFEEDDDEFFSGLDGEWINLPYIEHNGGRCIMIELQEIKASGEYTVIDLKKELGNYYSAMTALMLPERYSEMKADGSIVYYGMIPIEDFFDVAKGEALYISLEDRKFNAALIATYNPAISMAYDLKVIVEDEKLYINDVLYDEVSVVENPSLNFDHVVALFGVDGGQENWFVELIENIKSQKRCYLLANSADFDISNSVLLAYYIDGLCYFVSADIEENEAYVYFLHAEVIYFYPDEKEAYWGGIEG